MIIPRLSLIWVWVRQRWREAWSNLWHVCHICIHRFRHTCILFDWPAYMKECLPMWFILMTECWSKKTDESRRLRSPRVCLHFYEEMCMVTYWRFSCDVRPYIFRITPFHWWQKSGRFYSDLRDKDSSVSYVLILVPQLLLSSSC